MAPSFPIQTPQEIRVIRRIAQFTALCAIIALAMTVAAGAQAKSRNTCGTPAPGNARCYAKVVTNGKGAPVVTTSPKGLTPANLQEAYGLTAASATLGSTSTIAIVDAYDLPTAEADLAVYRKQFGLAPCTTANGCFRKVNQKGNASPLPKVNAGWGQEIALDIEMASAACPRCRILLVEANSAQVTDLGIAVNTAVALGATVVSNSYGLADSKSLTPYYPAYDHPGVAFTVSSGDWGFGAEFPASSPAVTAVGGTALTRDSSSARGWKEVAWSGSGSGCAVEATKPAWQTDTLCATRTIADLSAVASPSTGVAVYDSTMYQGVKGWFTLGGTSVGAPLIAGAYGLAAAWGPTDYPVAQAHAAGGTSAFTDVTSGSNLSGCTSAICLSGAGYDGPTGWGTPFDTGAL